MAEYIKRDNSLLIYISEGAYEQIQRIPAADVVPVRHGHFGKHTSPFTAPCSECGTSMNTHWHYCPNCGARMDKEVEHE